MPANIFTTNTRDTPALVGGVATAWPSADGWDTDDAATFAVDVIPPNPDQVDTITVERSQYGGEFVPDLAVNTALAAAAPFTATNPASIEYARPPGARLRITLTSAGGINTGLVVTTRRTGSYRERPAR